MTLNILYRTITKLLTEVSESPALDARILCQFCLNLNDSQFITKGLEDIGETESKQIMDCVRQRLDGKPIAYITKRRDFYGMTFYTPENVLIPQPDTETLVEEAIKEIREKYSGKDFSVLDLCAGTGCIGISIALEASKVCKTVNLTLSDISQFAYEAFSENVKGLVSAQNIKVEMLKGDMFSTVEGRIFSMIVSNPPYIRSSIIGSLPAEVRSEPLLALDGGENGLVFIGLIAEKAGKYLEDDGVIFVEIGYDQGGCSKSLFEGAGWKDVVVIKDIAGNDRVVKCNK